MKRRCKICKKRLNAFTEFTCKCKELFCAAHRLAAEHNCSYDYRKEHKEKLEKIYRRLTPKKIVKI